MSYSILAIPCSAAVKLSDEAVGIIEDVVQEKYGAGSLHPDVIDQLVKAVSDENARGAVALEVLKQIVAGEHTLGEHYYKQVKKDLETQLAHQTYNSNYVTTTAEAINKCWATHPISSAILGELYRDLYGERDSQWLFGPPEFKGYGASYAPMRTTDVKVDAKFAMKEQLEAALKSFTGASHAVAIVVVDADYQYVGHVYTWTSHEAQGVAQVIGIRSSLLNQVCRKVPSVSTKLFHGVALWAKAHHLTTISVHSPFLVMQTILEKKLGFQWDAEENLSGSVADALKLLANDSPTFYTGYGVLITDVLAPLVFSKEFLQDVEQIATLLHVLPDQVMDYLTWTTLNDPELFWSYGSVVHAVETHIKPLA
ncbi:Hypothetical protein POVN_LOCUS135 [uncultured virus]|nr:Hypothetical protein POVN_LOCUS135 [uncultured virus]